jgi:hypothetical protein
MMLGDMDTGEILIKALLRLYSGSIQALFRLYQGPYTPL